MADVNKIDDGGHAYPVCFEGGKNSGEQPYFHEGMSLRDHFAGQALPAVIEATASGRHHVDTKNGEVGIRLAMARDAYELADAMIAARKGGAA